jgi:NAD(P)-dependent dehydrogenase (short-subunit alcohol dehydrogenase family)
MDAPVTLITGGSSGIGAAAAKQLLNRDIASRLPEWWPAGQPSNVDVSTLVVRTIGSPR